jgi:uncharacterized membrane protein
MLAHIIVSQTPNLGKLVIEVPIVPLSILCGVALFIRERVFIKSSTRRMTFVEGCFVNMV